MLFLNFFICVNLLKSVLKSSFLLHEKSFFPFFMKIVSTLRDNYREGALYEYGKRLEQLQALYRMVEENEGELLEALQKDLGKVSY